MVEIIQIEVDNATISIFVHIHIFSPDKVTEKIIQLSPELVGVSD